MLRIAASVVMGTLAAFAVIALIELAGHFAFPLPEDVNLRDPEALAQAMPSIPLPAKLIVVFAWFAGALAGGLVARRLDGRWWTPWPVAGLVVLAGLLNILMVPHPAWMLFAAVAAPLAGGLAAAHLGPREAAR